VARACGPGSRRAIKVRYGTSTRKSSGALRRWEVASTGRVNISYGRRNIFGGHGAFLAPRFTGKLRPAPPRVLVWERVAAAAVLVAGGALSCLSRVLSATFGADLWDDASLILGLVLFMSGGFGTAWSPWTYRSSLDARLLHDLD
jgi:hypothetical protein